MEATLLSSHHFTPQLFTTTPVKLGGGHVLSDNRFCHPLCTKTFVSVRLSLLDSKRRQVPLLIRPFLSRANKWYSVYSSDQLRSDYMNVEASSALSVNLEAVPPRLDDEVDNQGSRDVTDNESFRSKPKMYKNRFLNFIRLSSVLNNAAESFFKSEIRRRLFVTAILIVISRIGYFVPLPGFDRRLMPQDYLSFVLGYRKEVGALYPMPFKLLFCKAQHKAVPLIFQTLVMKVVELRCGGVEVDSLFSIGFNGIGLAKDSRAYSVLSEPAMSTSLSHPPAAGSWDSEDYL
ncbi:hypothetical protein WN944_026081 [Citrus x changshan-huyou]|uniref:Uncharacterized protein n=1 Tax=Citrus x changshan-huyou TaxID=2935761 RepID=A0AAP0LR02_9ROSI